MAACRSACSRSGYVQLDFERTDISFALKSYHPLPYRHTHDLTAQQIKDGVFQATRLQEMMREIAEERSVKVEEVEKEVRQLLDEIGHTMHLAAVRTLAFILRGPIRRVIRGIHINAGGLEKVREAVQQWPVLLLPSHRSYLDFILVTFFLFEHNIQIPCIAAGQDFMNMKLVSHLLRCSGAFFLRRTFGSDNLYKLIFTLYIQTLLSGSGMPVEFFIEGTRSRTAKSLHPKLGMLSMLVEPYLNGVLPDIIMFPISISYERTLEEELFSWELLGQPKPKESTKGLMKALSLLNEDYGSIFINISAPISLHNFCQQHGISRIPHGLHPRHTMTLSAAERLMISDLGYTLVDQLDQNMVIFPSSLISALLLQQQRSKDPQTGSISREELTRQAEWLKREVEWRGGVVYWPTDADAAIRSGLSLLSSCVEEEEGVVKVAGGVPVQHTQAPLLDQEELEEVMKRGAVHLKLAHYRNKLLHLFVPEAMLMMALQEQEETLAERAQLQFSVLHAALAREFVLPHHLSTQQLFQHTLQQLVDRGVVEWVDDITLCVNEQQIEMADFLAQLILPFIAGVWVLCHQLLSLRGGVQTLKRTYTEAQHKAVRLIHTGQLCSYEPLSRDMLKNAMTSLDLLGLIMELELELEGRDRLVKVAQQDKLQELTDQLGTILFPSGNVPLPPFSHLHSRI